ncbi:hypothetical protein Csp1_15870 [Corynebacterium provencense]|uniref:DUF6815 domain-containing protein n=1 Tax=Corynebacterium provencense TaxID=1737425 RepID=A0A2Z3YRV0_9CORY|nr:hypothetical protein Csp1_15870 [Corynebacterium provencense]
MTTVIQDDRAGARLRRAIAVFETEGGGDKDFTGHRRDTMPIVQSIRDLGWRCEVIYYRPEWEEELFAHVSGSFAAYISRVNPGTVPGGEAGYLRLLGRLSGAGLVGMPTPQDMLAFGAKDALVRLVGTPLVPPDTAAYYDTDTFHRTFPTSLSFGERVLKQNRGSAGSGIWRVRVDDDEVAAASRPGTALPADTVLRCTEAADNHTEIRRLDEFMRFCDSYIHGDNGMIVDMRFMPRIVEGEIRILMVGDEPVFVVHKKPAEGGENFSATLFSGARYTYGSPGEWPELVGMFGEAMPFIAERLGAGGSGHGDVPLLWSADFMLDTADDGSDSYVLGEINCSCVGFTSELDMGIQEKVAAEAVRKVLARHAGLPVHA